MMIGSDFFDMQFLPMGLSQFECHITDVFNRENSRQAEMLTNHMHGNLIDTEVIRGNEMK
jgi:hypothetical protein